MVHLGDSSAGISCSSLVQTQMRLAHYGGLGSQAHGKEGLISLPLARAPHFHLALESANKLILLVPRILGTTMIGDRVWKVTVFQGYEVRAI
jgi:hypothetical protein